MKLVKRPSHATAVAYVALFVNQIDGSRIKDGTMP
jgi:hypothetical protein